MSHPRRAVGYLLAAIALVTGTLLFAFGQQHSEAVHAADHTGVAVNALTAVLDQETGLRGFLRTGREDFLQPYFAGQSAYEQDRIAVNAAAAGDRQSERLAYAEDAAARYWQAYAEGAIAERRLAKSDAVSANEISEALLGKQHMDRFRDINGQLRQRLDARRDATLRRSGVIATALIVAVAGALAAIGLVVVYRSSRRAVAGGETEIAYRVKQREFTDLVQAVESESEAHQLVRRHLERSLPGAVVSVLIRNNSDNRLQAATTVEAGSALGPQLVGAEPRSCLAIRLGRCHEDGRDQDRLLACALCSGAEGTATCEPLLVGGKVIGSVLVESQDALTEADRRCLADTVTQSAPVLANLKSLAIAESRAATDSLTGLPNRRAMQDTIKRLAAHAGRGSEPLAAIAIDLDHFKRINDQHGHEVGDAALSAVGECLRDTLREADFAARVGGEEFLVLAPATDTQGALVLAEKLRAALRREEVPQLGQSLTASFGVAVIPEHAGTAEQLLRRADQACYLAKERGRNRIELCTRDDASPLAAPFSVG